MLATSDAGHRSVSRSAAAAQRAAGGEHVINQEHPTAGQRFRLEHFDLGCSVLEGVRTTSVVGGGSLPTLRTRQHPAPQLTR